MGLNSQKNPFLSGTCTGLRQFFMRLFHVGLDVNDPGQSYEKYLVFYALQFLLILNVDVQNGACTLV